MRTFIVRGLLVGASTATVLAQTPTIPSVRPLGARISATHDTLVSVRAMRVLSDGRVIVDDQSAHRVEIFDAALEHPVTVLDTSGQTRRAFTSPASFMAPFIGDTTAFFDPMSLAFLILDPSGHIVRTISAPTPTAAAGFLQGGAIDPEFRVVYQARPGAMITSNGMLGYEVFEMDIMSTADTSYLVRASLMTHKVDTLTTLSVERFKVSALKTDSAGGRYIARVLAPAPITDDWGMLADGTVEVFRGADYHADIFAPSGTKSVAPTVAHVWRRRTDADRDALVDSLRTLAAKNPVPVQVMGPGSQRATRSITPDVIAASALPDYAPPFVAGTMVDHEDRFWLRESQIPLVASQFPTVYDVVTRDGKLVDRVEIPIGTQLVGFGPHTVFLTSKVGKGVQLAEFRVK